MPEPTDEQLAAWQALCDVATPGPWECYLLREHTPIEEGTTPDVFVDPENPEQVCAVTNYRDDDAAFIAAARMALPVLLAEVRRLRANEREAVALERQRCAAFIDRAAIAVLRGDPE